MNDLLIFGVVIILAALVLVGWLGWQLVQQNGRMLLRFESLERRLDEIMSSAGHQTAQSEELKREAGESPATSAATSNDEERADRFRNRSLANSKIKRDGLKAGTPAPEFRLPRLDGGELALLQLRGRLVLLVFSSPRCGPCNALATKLQKFHRKHPEVELVMISRESHNENRAKVKEHGLTFPVVLQKQWEVSRDYAFFATPVAYLIDEAGTIAADVAVGVDAILNLTKRAELMLHSDCRSRRQEAPINSGVRSPHFLLAQRLARFLRVGASSQGSSRTR
jgi:peroxiredoxin